jgi:AcrR family transcriptional regulator
MMMNNDSVTPGSGADPARTRLLRAAEELFGSRSFHATKVADLTAHAGLATGSFYRYFPSKVDLIVALLGDLNARLRAEMRAATADAVNQREIERRAFDAFFRFFAAHPYLYRIQRQAEFVAPAAYRQYFEDLARRYARGAKEAMVRGDVDAAFDPEVLGYVYLGIAHFVGQRWVEWTGGAPVPDDVAEQVYALLDKAMRPRDDAGR